MKRGRNSSTVALNRRARYDFELLETFEAGLVLQGTEVKALRSGHGDIQRAFAYIRNGEAFLVGAHIGEYREGNIHNHDPERDRKLLLHRRQLNALQSKVQERNLTLIPTRLYFKNGKVKIEIALARGKDTRDKRRDITERDLKRQLERAVKGDWQDT